MKSIEEQIQAMAFQWPGFKVVEQTDRTVMWEGLLAPDKRAHLVRIGYRRPNLLENITLHDAQPRVQVINPLLEPHADYEQGPIPHVYPSAATPSMPFLCLFSPARREWSITDLIAETTVFWTSEWLYFYEGWLVTKMWRGGGRHPPQHGDGAKRLETV